MKIDFPKAQFRFLRSGKIVTVVELNSMKRMDFIDHSDNGNIDTDFVLLGFVTAFPDVEIS